MLLSEIIRKGLPRARKVRLALRIGDSINLNLGKNVCNNLLVLCFRAKFRHALMNGVNFVNVGAEFS